MKPQLFSAMLLAAGTMACPGQDRSPVEPAALPAPDQVVAETKPVIEKIDESRFRIGKVIIDKKTREIRFPAKVNMTEGLLEYLVVHQNGKIHESLFFTDVSPTHINLGFTLLRYQASRELYALINEKGMQDVRYPVVSDEVKAAARVIISAEWEQDGKTRKIPVNDMIQHAVKTTSMPPGPWVYGASEFYDGQYVPETTGDIAAIFVARSSMINYPGEDNYDDTVWEAFTKRIPPEGTNVTIIIAPYPQTQSNPKP
jgi:hypothetical protein